MKQTFQMIVLVTCALFMALTVQAQNATKVYQQVSPDNNVIFLLNCKKKANPLILYNTRNLRLSIPVPWALN